MRIKLSPAFIARAEAEPGAERSIYWDTELSGFGLQVTRAGHRSFVVQYRANGRSRRMAINAALRLSEARKEARATIGAVARGGDPLAERRKTNDESKNTLRAVVDSYYARNKDKLRRAGDMHRALTRLALPTLGNRQIASIKLSDLTHLLDRIEDRNGPQTADHILSYLGTVFNWHAARTDDFRTPIVRGMRRTDPDKRNRGRFLTDDELRKIWLAAGKMNGPFGAMVKVLLLTAGRRNEIAKLRRDEIRDGVIMLPASRSKIKKEEVRPLSRTAEAVISALPVIGGSTDGPVFTYDGKRPIAGYTEPKRELDKLSGVFGWRLHDLRRTARTLLSRAGVNADIAERCLGHVIGGVRGVYDKHSYLPEKRAAFEELAAQIERIINPQENVIPLRASP